MPPLLAAPPGRADYLALILPRRCWHREISHLCLMNFSDIADNNGDVSKRPKGRGLDIAENNRGTGWAEFPTLFDWNDAHIGESPTRKCFDILCSHKNEHSPVDCFQPSNRRGKKHGCSSTMGQPRAGLYLRPVPPSSSRSGKPKWFSRIDTYISTCRACDGNAGASPNGVHATDHNRESQYSANVRHTRHTISNGHADARALESVHHAVLHLRRPAGNHLAPIGGQRAGARQPNGLGSANADCKSACNHLSHCRGPRDHTRSDERLGESHLCQCSTSGSYGNDCCPTRYDRHQQYSAGWNCSGERSAPRRYRLAIAR